MVVQSRLILRRHIKKQFDSSDIRFIMKFMTNTIPMACVAFLLFGFNLPSYGDTVAGGGGSSTVSSSSADKAAGCQTAGAMRLVLDSVAHTCQASASAQGSMPEDNLGCGAPSQEGNSKSMAKYVWGGKAQMGGSTMTVPSGLDCSGLICAGACRAGIPIQPGNACAALDTKAMDQLFSSGASCYKPIDGNGGTGQSHLQAGDLIEYQHDGKSGGHTYAIERTDPNDCHKVCIIQEESTKTGGGITCTGGGPTGDAQGLSLDDVIQANCSGSGAGGANAKTKVMRYDPSKSGCQEQNPKPISNGQNCDVGEMPRG